MLNSWYVGLDTFVRLAPPVCLYLLVFRNFFRFSKKTTGMIAFVFFCIFIPLPGILYHYYAGFDPWLSLFSSSFFLILISASFLLIRFSPYQQLLVLFLLESYVDNITLLRDGWVRHLSNLLPDFPYILLEVYLLIIMAIVTFPLLLYFFLKMVRPIVESDEHQPYHKYLWLIPACFFVIFRICIVPDEFNHPAYPSKVSLLLALAWCFGTFLVYVLILRMLQETMNKAELQRRLEVSSMTNSIQMKLYENLLHQIQENRRAVHDFRHNILVMKNYCEAKQYQELDRYLEQYIGSLSLEHHTIFCANVLVNGLLQYYYHIAAEHEISCEFNFMIPQHLAMQDADLCTLLGNALENAIEACCRQKQGERFIALKAELYQEVNFVITIKNSYEGVIRKNDAGVLLSSKRNEEGIGVSSIQNVVTKYHGVCKLSYDEHIFTLSIMLILPK